MITPQMKDKVLSYIVKQELPRFMIRLDDLSVQLDIKPDYISLIIEQFKKMGLCEINETRGIGFPPTAFIITLTANAYDANRNGGFVFQEEIMKANLLKLDMELNQLSNESSGVIWDRVQKIMSIVNLISITFPFINR